MAVPRDHPSYLEIRWDVEKWMLLRLTNFGTQLAFNPGEAIVKEGEPADGLYLILSGAAQVQRGGDAGSGQKGTVLSTLGPFRSFGEISLLVEQPRTASVVATTPLRCVKLTRNQLALVEDKEPKLAVRLYRLVAESLARSLIAAPA
ncbi:MAG TPA: cyclic nucleotide-binding domain-containing protein [Methylomirabilota bacterium]|jgi:CRP-like cAMP-binding protein|nr:cyclic nucleotide-binding domain-containing protein [Methylomirabilota bacterium]